MANEALRDLVRLPLRTETSEPLMSTAWVVPERLGTSFYVTLAVQMNYAFVTADRKPYSASYGGDLDERMVWIEDPGVYT